MLSVRVAIVLFVIVASGCGQSAGPTEAPQGTPAAASAAPSVTSAVPSRAATPAFEGVSLRVIAARAAHTATTLPDGSVLITGGCVIDGCGKATAETFVIAPSGNSASAGPPLTEARDGHSATRVGDDVVIAGGFPGEGGSVLASVDIYRFDKGTVESASPLAVRRGGHGAAALKDGRVMVVGGWVASRTYTNSVEIIDPTSGEVVATSDLPWIADALEAVALADGRVLVTGGQVQSGVGTNLAAAYDPATESWTSVGPMSSARFKHTSVLLDDGRVLVIGGTTDDEKLLSSTEVFDPATGAFTPGPTLHEPRYKMTTGAISVGGNRVLISGGGLSVELVDVSAGKSTVVRDFAQRGSFATVTALGADMWLVIGGYDDRITLRREFLILGREEIDATAVE
jgi:hypothetical protein